MVEIQEAGEPVEEGKDNKMPKLLMQQWQVFFKVCSMDGHVLFDLGSTYSYISPYFASRFSEPPTRLDSPFLVSTPMGQSLIVQVVFRSCVVSVCGIDTLVDLMLLEMIDFDVILGMDWLASCHATVNCHLKEVRFKIPRGLQCMYKGNSCITAASLISCFRTLRMLSKGSQ